MTVAYGQTASSTYTASVTAPHRQHGPGPGPGLGTYALDPRTGVITFTSLE
ncbi:hypothetical protein GCM10011331_23450 [Flavimobilis marinus]|uniref:Uncharacterized protein n=1 Tax=Flavimobilis marinus TaxID=285351 RepID=A0A1I2GMD9_9MICO|nr:hypothetical protein [Flavimobilis marinus]GHG56199.1 hypothetical protein GCM10011331_23450 [Flavimobilis marinus]SFF17876.1 hypothetical protein SAMN04488035_1825 [Flavimobilis marinus]